MSKPTPPPEPSVVAVGVEEPTPEPAVRVRAGSSSGQRARQAATALVVSLAALTAHAQELEVVRDIQRYCVVCWKNAHLDPGLWDDCTQEVCCRLLGKVRAGELELESVLEDDTPERRELVRAIDMVRKRVQRARRHQSLDGEVGPDPVDLDDRDRTSLELGEILVAARREVLTPRQDQIIERWTHGWTVPEIAAELDLPCPRVSDEKYKALRKLQNHLANRRDELDV